MAVVIPSHLPAPRPRSAIAGVTSPMMMSGIEKVRNWLKRSEKVAKTRPTDFGMRGLPPTWMEPRRRARTMATMTHVRIPPLARTRRTFDMVVPFGWGWAAGTARASSGSHTSCHTELICPQRGRGGSGARGRGRAQTAGSTA